MRQEENLKILVSFENNMADRTERGKPFCKGHIPWNKGLGSLKKKCQNCSKSIIVQRSLWLQGHGKFCSKVCQYNYKFKLAGELKLNGDMAELVGIIIGDGCINKYSCQNSYRITISGNKIEDKPYLDKYVSNLIFRCIGRKPRAYLAHNGAYILHFSYEPLRIFLNCLGVTSNKTRTVKIPELIKQDNFLLRRCIRGIADTDFTLIGCSRFGKKNYYPRITAQFASESLVKDLKESLLSFGFTVNILCNKKRNNHKGNYWITNHINLDGPHNLQRWMKKIGFKNSRIITRYLCLKRLCMLPPKTTLPQRIRMLAGEGVVVNER